MIGFVWNIMRKSGIFLLNRGITRDVTPFIAWNKAAKKETVVDLIPTNMNSCFYLLRK